MSIVASYEKPSYSDVLAPFLKIDVSNPLEEPILTLKALIDTGFDGEIIIPMITFHELQLFAFELNRDQFSIAETASGEHLTLTSANGQIRINQLDLSINVIVDTHEKCQEVILGRKFLEGFEIHLYGKDKRYEFGLM